MASLASLLPRHESTLKSINKYKKPVLQYSTILRTNQLQIFSYHCNQIKKSTVETILK